MILFWYSKYCIFSSGFMVCWLPWWMGKGMLWLYHEDTTIFCV